MKSFKKFITESENNMTGPTRFSGDMIAREKIDNLWKTTMLLDHKDRGPEKNIFYSKDKTGNILHREDGPACIFGNGDYNYIVNNEFHHLGGPASCSKDGSGDYYINGKKYTPEEYWKHPDVIAYKTVKDAGGDPRLLDI